MEWVAGVTLALFVAASARMTGFDRERSFYPVVLIVIASYYGLFAVMAGSLRIFSLEMLAMALFIALALTGFRRSLWLVVTALMGHGVFDLAHAHLIANPWVPKWWPGFCLGYDFVAAACLGWLLMRTARLAAGAGTRKWNGRPLPLGGLLGPSRAPPAGIVFAAAGTRHCAGNSLTPFQMLISLAFIPKWLEAYD